ncbi:hypothetical protein NHX12_029070 [Muraenolepis orangiensis]|uniref:Exonuclease domain-containing protein n=1 Tax=Muraenolepis orangiensis TaxID=630683 RepID=A0A9Q0IMT6_9TELE|nr:hypothetical protein NHX12_029070 [Muraenolepis orangiensis]
MLPSSGLFAVVVCPFRYRGLCERPHCLYKHEKEQPDMFGASLKSAAVGLVDFPGIPNYPQTSSSACIQELARINQEIEDVKVEVDQEQRRLSRYQTEQVDGASAATRRRDASRPPAGKRINGEAYKPPPPHRRTPGLSSQARKYVVDNSKPRTDLEYDPLSNFSADLRSSSSSGKEPKAGVKRGRDALGGDRHKLQSAGGEAATVLEDDVVEEGDLVIDFPSSPNVKKRRVHNVIERQPLVAEQGHSTPTQIHTSSPEVFQGESSSFILIDSDESITCDMFEDLSKCLEDLRSENQKVACSHAVGPVEERGSSFDGEVKGRPQVTETFQDHFQDMLQLVEFFENSSQTSQAYADETMIPAPPMGDPHPVPSEVPHVTHQTEEPAAHTYMAQPYWLSANGVPMVMPCGQAHADPPAEHPPPSATSAGGDHTRPLYTASTSNVRPHSPSPPGRASPSGGGDPILIESSEEESVGETPLNYSDIDMSDSDPMEECYRIFMEASEVAKAAPEPVPQAPVMSVSIRSHRLDPSPCLQVLTPSLPPCECQLAGASEAESETPAVEEKPQALPAPKRLSHVSRRPEPVAVLRPQPQVLVPLQGGPFGHGSGPKLPKIQQVQQRASVKGGQAFALSTHHRRPEAGAPPLPTQSPAHPPVSVQSGYMNCIPMGNGVFQVGNNLHFILQDGAVLTPVSSSGAGPVQSFQLSPVTPGHRYRPAPSAPVHMELGNVSSLPSVSALGQAPAPSGPQGALHVPPKRYVNMFTDEFLRTCPSVKDAFDKALAEERTVFNRSVNKLKYLSVAVNVLKRLKNPSAAPTKGENDVSGKRARGNVPLNMSRLVGNGDAALYDSLKAYIINEEKLVENNFPLLNPERPGNAIRFGDNKKGINDPLKRLCCRCGATYSVSKTGKHTRKDECNYHYGKGLEKKVPGGVETRYSCCEGVMGAPGCQVFRLHVHDEINLDGFVSSQPREAGGCPGVYSLDCEMCYTTHGLELSRVTVVNSGLQAVYDTFVKPENDVVDFNTRFSGISEKDLTEACPSIREVQQTLLRFVWADTILVGHGLETSLCALKFVHGTVVDTSVVFPHRLGPPHKLTLNNLTADHLSRIIQDSVCGHDTADDAAACMELVLWKVKEDGKGRKW